MPSVDDLHIDDTKLAGDNGEVYLLHWLSTAEKAIRELGADVLKPAQAGLESTLIKIGSAADAYPLPGRSTRQLVARCLVTLYSKAETRSLFDTVQAFNKVANELKPTENKDARVTAIFCIGELMAALGSQVMSLATDTALLCLRTAKASANSILLRYNALVCLRKMLTTASRALTDSTLKDILKQSRGYLSDKALPIQRAAAEVLVVLYPADDGSRTGSDVESIVQLCIKSLEGADQQTRRSLARLVGHMLASTQVERKAPPEPAKKGKKEQDDDGDVPIPAAIQTEGPKLILTPNQMLQILSLHFNKATVSRKTRIGIFDFYSTLLLTLGPAWVEANYALIVRHLFTEVVTSMRSTSSRFEILTVRKLVGVLLRDLIALRMLSEQGQIGAIRELSLAYIKKWPAVMPGQYSPNQLVLVIALREIAGLLQQLGSAPPPVQDVLADPLVELLAHPTHSVRVAAAWALRCFCQSAPRRLAKAILTVLESLQNNISALTSSGAPLDVNKRAIGSAYGLAALFSVIPDKPLYVSYDLSAKVLDVAIQLLKRSGEHDLKIAAVEVEVAWTCISSLMCLGPNFVRAHLPQLMVLWRNALPKPTSKDTTLHSGRTDQEWGFLLHLRECALGAILCFLQNNATLITLDVSRRVSSLLNNALLFANAWIAQTEDNRETGPTTQPDGVPLSTREAMLRRRIYQCYSAVGFSSLTFSATEQLLQSAVTLFASADSYLGSAMQAAIATSAGSFTSIWLSADGYGFGVSQLACAHAATTADGMATDAGERFNRDTIEASIDNLISIPVLGSLEHDTSLLWRPLGSNINWPEPAPPATAVVDAAINLFAQLLPLQDPSLCTKMVALIAEGCRSPKLERNVGRKTAVFVNATTAIMLALRVAGAGAQRQAREALGNPQVTSTLTELLKGSIANGDVVLRSAGSEAMGRLAGLAGTTYLTSQITTLVEQVVNNRDPDVRAGCALAFGAIYSHVGVLAAGPLLKTAVNVLMSLGTDPHPLVHFWALSALSEVVNAASLSYAPFINTTIGMLVKMYSMESHEPEGGSLNNANIAGDLPTYQVVCRIIDALVGVVGPELQESSHKRNVILDLVTEFMHESDAGINVEAIRCIEHFLIFAPSEVDVPDLIRRLRSNMGSTRRPLKVASINALYRLVQRDAVTMSKVGGDKLVEDLFSMLDDDATIEGVRNVITSWLTQTAAQNPSAWIDLCQRIMSRTTASQQATDAANQVGGLRDEESESLGVVASGGGGAERQTSRWRTQLFALQCLHEICKITVASGVREHLDIPYAKRRGLPTQRLLVSRVPDLIKMAFTASAAHVPDIRQEGLVVLRDVIEIFASAPDPDYEDALFLEQHQAPITAALTPAFGHDSTPEVLAAAVQVCAVFVGSGVVKDVSRMGRILKLLTTALEQSKGFGTLSIGDLGQLSPNASVMLRISTLTAWAELQIASEKQKYLHDVLNPHRATLATLWIASLRDYASIRVDSEVLQDPASAALDSSYFGLGREVLLPYYARSSPRMLKAGSMAMQSQDPNVLAAMDGLEAPAADAAASKPGEKRSDPTAFFFPVFGLVCEALSSQSADPSSGGGTLEMTITALDALKSLVRPEYSGSAILEPAIFDELIGLCYRLALTEPAVVQRHLVEMVSSLAVSQGDRLLKRQTNGHVDSGFPSNTPLSDCLRICAFVLRHAVPTSRTPPGQQGNSLPERVAMLNATFAAFNNVAAQFGPKHREDLRAVGISLYSAFLKDELSEQDLVGPTLHSLKSLLDVTPDVTVTAVDSAYSRVVHGLLSACLLNMEEMRGREGNVPNLKTKNNMLAAVLMLTGVPVGVKLSQVAVEQCCFLLSQRLTEIGDLSLTAAHCTKTLIHGATAGNPTLQHCVKALVPGMITYVARVASLASDPAVPPPELHVKAAEEVLKAFTAFYNSLPESKKTLALAVLLPVEVMLLDPSKTPLSLLHVHAVTQLLTFATTTPVAFKEAAAKLDQPIREKLETSVRQALAGNSSGASSQTAKPTISLRSF